MQETSFHITDREAECSPGELQSISNRVLLQSGQSLKDRFACDPLTCEVSNSSARAAMSSCSPE